MGLPYGSLRATGADGYYWTMAVYSDARAYNLYFYVLTTNPSNSDNHYPAFPMRCVAL